MLSVVVLLKGPNDVQTSASLEIAKYYLPKCPDILLNPICLICTEVSLYMRRQKTLKALLNLPHALRWARCFISEYAQSHLVKSQKYFYIVMWMDKTKLELFRGNGSAINLYYEENSICRDKTLYPP